MPLVTTTCNQCEQNRHTQCPAENLVRRDLIRNAGDHCYCASQGHTTPETNREQPKIKTMLGKQDKERDVPVDHQVVVEQEADSVEGDDD